MVRPNDTTNVTSPGSGMPITSGRQPARLSRASAAVTPAIGPDALAASGKRMATNSATAISPTANLVAGVADAHRQTAASMARLASTVLGTITGGGARGGLSSARDWRPLLARTRPTSDKKAWIAALLGP